MVNKIIRLFCYIKELFLMIFFIPVGYICSAVNKKYKDVWLVSERGNDARDNGYWFYKYLREEQPSVNSYFVIDKKSEDFDKIAAIGGAVDYKSFKHYLMYYSAKYLIGTHVQPAAPDKMMYFHLASKGIRPKGKQIFLQHGIILSDMSWMSGGKLYIDLFVCGAKPEYEHIKNNYNHPENVVQYLGLCRFDNLIKVQEAEKIILVMPTWRGSAYPTGEKFVESEYYKSFNSMLNNKALAEMLEKYDYKLIFYPHIEMQKNLSKFHTDCERIIIGGKADFDVQELLMKCSLLITDYSSVFFDVAFLNKPILYYQFDEEEFHRYHYPKGYFDFRKDGFGSVCRDEEKLVEKIGECFGNNMSVEDLYRVRANKFFELHDDCNCKRIYAAVCSLK